MYDRHIAQLRLDFSLALALAEQRDKVNVEGNRLSELQRLASLVEDMKQQVTEAQGRIQDARYDHDLIIAFENCMVF